MSLLDTHRFDRISENEVLCRIADLLAKAMRRDQLLRSSERALAGDVPAEPAEPVDWLTLVKDPQEQEMARYLARTGSASPKDFSLALGIARRTVTRKLAHLCAAGLCEAAGHTKATRYRLRTDHSRN
jgi:predicted HTH transcriptional regulator